MLERILSDMVPFTCVLVFIIMSFAAVFFLLVRDADVPYSWDMGHDFQTLGMSAASVVGMALGDFSIEYYRQAPHPTFTVLLFMLFMFVVPIVMLNALIAIMTNSFEQVKGEQLERKVLERAHLLLELQSVPGVPLGLDCLPCLRLGQDADRRYIHVLRPEISSRNEKEVDDTIV
jgi:transient receptor potential cation channel subfamily V protein 6